jgi:dTMP kinase
VEPGHDDTDSEVGPNIDPTAPTELLDARSEAPTKHVRLFGTHQFFRLWLAQVVSSLGDWLGFLAITLTATRVGGGNAGAAVGVVMTARIVPGFFLGPLAGVLVDRLDRKKVMVVCDLARAAVLVFLPFVDTVLGLVIASLLLEVFTLLWSPAKEASVPNLVPPERLASSNSLSLAAAYGSLPVASVVFAVLGGVQDSVDTSALRLDQEGTLAFYADAVTFSVSALLIATLGLGPASRSSGHVESTAGIGETIRELREGWSFIFANPVVRAVNIGLATGLIGGGMIVPLGAVFSRDVLGAGDAGYGVFVTALGVGAAIGIVLVSLVQRHLPKDLVFTIAVFAAGGCLASAAAFSTLGPAVACVVAFGVCAGTAYVTGFTLLHEHVDDELRGRIFSALYVIVRLCLLIAFTVGPFLSGFLDGISRDVLSDRNIELFGGEVFLPGVRLTLWLSAVIIVIAGVLVVLSLRAEHIRQRRLARA